MAEATARSRRQSQSKAKDAIALLKADHQQVKEWFEQFDKARDDSRKQALASSICNALRVHTIIEEEIFYPVFLDETEDEDIHHEAIVEHNGAKNLIGEIERMVPTDDYFDAKVRVLSEMIKHHVKEEEKPDGMFDKAKKSDMDLKRLGDLMQARKDELQRDKKD